MSTDARNAEIAVQLAALEYALFLQCKHVRGKAGI